ncbi:ATP-binding protein [Sphingomonas sp.]|uniref:ATP-binding protein n=1 Tax=Sphingomonas sp. TaxID=28214 RepID=UPI003B004F25
MGHGQTGVATGDGPPQAGDAGRPVPVVLVVAALVALAAIAFLVLRVGHSLGERDRAVDRERHGYQVVLATRSVSASIASAEAALGRYAISGDRAMGATYYDDWVMAGAQIGRLRQLVARDPVASALADRLGRLFETRGRELGAPASSAARHDGWTALSQFNATGRSPRIAAIDQVLEAIRQHEVGVLRHRADQSDAATSDTTHLIGLLSLTGLLLIVATGGLAMAFSVATRNHRVAQDEADDAADRASWLCEAVAARTAELTAMNERLNTEMAERAAAEARLGQMQKMEALGQLTGGIAHDFNNMLAVVVGGLELARRRLATAPDSAAEHLDRAMEGANRAAGLTRRLLGFARAEPLLPERVAPAALISGMSDLLDRTLGERVRIEVRTTGATWPVFVDPLQFENAILNLAVNGRDAMEGAGTLVVSAEDVGLREREVGELPAGDYVRVAVADAGIGMAPEILSRVFEPFFTTKPVGKGTGLGLSQIFGFARQSGGDVAIGSTPGAGTTVSLYLPRAIAAAPPAPPPRAVADIVRLPVARAAGPRPVLLVEDDPRVRAATAGALEELGYDPIACDDPAHALAMLADRADVRVMVTDVVMPVMTGPELAAEARRRRPDLSVLFVTGYAREDAGELAGEAMLRKPFTFAALDRAVADAFAAEPLSAPRRAQAGGAAD